MIDYFVSFSVIFFVIVLLVCTYIMVKGIIYDWAFFKPLLFSIMQGIILACMYITFIAGAVNLPEYVSKYFG